ncbi:hypothetical protein M514_12241 [Trichuris suis]|uniref:FLYWCH-type domain-containing protein n=1 Tax=Trichuris suis TaxID=68888 RepID=A0A085MV80_9BILA|nr:hypothetical protein M514_12241 [Trichuris suis]
MAYGAVAYLRVRRDPSDSSVGLPISESRIASSKEVMATVLCGSLYCGTNSIAFNKMEETCEVVVPQKGERYYWCCDHRKSLYCGGRAISCFRNGQHVLRKFADHNHVPVASAPYVAAIVEEIKTRARSTADLPCQTVRSCTTPAPPNIAPYLPSKAALNESIRHVRRAERPREPRSLAEVAIPEELQRTLTGEPFLISDLAVEDHRMLIFASKADMEKLSAASLWIMDGTFKTVPRLF